MPKTNDPYSRPINATRPEGQMLQGEFYGDKATDKALHSATGGRAVHQVRPMQSVVPDWPEDRPTPPTTRKKKVTTPTPDVTLPNGDASSPSDDAARVTDAITEDDLFG